MAHALPQPCLHDPDIGRPSAYLPFPESWRFTPLKTAGRLARLYAVAMDLNSGRVPKSSTPLRRREERVDLQVRRSDGTVQTLHPAHVVLATGVHGETNRAQFEGHEELGADYSLERVHGRRPQPGTRAIRCGGGLIVVTIWRGPAPKWRPTSLSSSGPHLRHDSENGLPTLFDRSSTREARPLRTQICSAHHFPIRSRSNELCTRHE